ncbi:hypothetical protein AURDEDRAFT_159232 [Auricularia subglabra TFB-10046 SS5]|nr:hypothetical protein AURDEDRAFT_159232 [Auricularia subglabra TFB-10046 SS5]
MGQRVSAICLTAGSADACLPRRGGCVETAAGTSLSELCVSGYCKTRIKELESALQTAERKLRALVEARDTKPESVRAQPGEQGSQGGIARRGSRTPETRVERARSGWEEHDRWTLGKIASIETRSTLEGYFDGDAGTYDQLSFVQASVVENTMWRSAAARTLAEASARRTSHFIWTMEEYNTPVPLGKYGQPYFKDSTWEDFNPLRLWKDISPGRVTKGDELWVRLAVDAAKLPFEYRSDAQRIVVSEAHRVKVVRDGVSRFVLPVDGEVAEVDIWHQCVNNALYMPLAVRRHYSYDRKTKQLFREWDAGDLGIYVIMRACGPEGEKRREKEKRKQGEGDRRSVAASWTEQFRRAVLFAVRGPLNEGPAGSAEHTRPRRYQGDENEAAVYEHLLRCGFSRERMEAGGDVHAYAKRMEGLETQFQELRAVLVGEGGTEDGLDSKDLVARAKCRLELRGDRMDSGRPRVRCRVRAKDPLGQELIKELTRQEAAICEN